jgi:hypothetical protein
MSTQEVRKVIGRMVADEQFRQSVFADARKAIADAGFQLTNDELNAFSNLKPDDLTIDVRQHGAQPMGGLELSKVTF